MSRRIDVFIPDLRGGGAERVAVHLANALAVLRRDVRLLTLSRTGPCADLISGDVRVEELGARRMMTAIPALVSAFRNDRPDVVISHITHGNIACLGAAAMTGLMGRTMVVEHNQFDRITAGPKGWPLRMAYRAVPWMYRGAGAVVAVSDGVSRKLTEMTGLAHPVQRAIPNPVITADFDMRMRQSAPHPWLENKPLRRPPGEVRDPVIVTLGSLTTQKDHDTLLQAMRTLNKLRGAGRSRPRLIIYGEGVRRASLQALRDELCLAGQVDLPGFIADPLPALARADLFVLSSRWEGLPTALIEALGCGANCVSTDCESGPADILTTTRIGRLCPPGDAEALARTMLEALEHPVDPARARERARDYSVEAAARHYADLGERLISVPRPSSIFGAPVFSRSRPRSG